MDHSRFVTIIFENCLKNRILEFLAISREKLDPGPGGNDWVDICNNGDNSRHCMLEEESPSRLGVG